MSGTVISVSTEALEVGHWGRRCTAVHDIKGIWAMLTFNPCAVGC